MIVTRKALSRRTLLRGMGAAIGLPFLDAMTPAFAASSAWAHGPVRPVWLHGSSVTTAIAPRAADPADASASTSA